MTPTVIKDAKRKYVSRLAITISFVLAGAVMVANDDGFEAWLGWANIVLFGAAVALVLWQLVDVRPRLVIDGRGVLDRTLGVGVIPWSEITGAYVRSVYSVDFICLELRDPRPWLKRLSPIKRALVPANQAWGFTVLNLNLGDVVADVRQVHELIMNMVAARQGFENSERP